MALSILLTDIGSLTTSKFCLLNGTLGADANGTSSDDITIDNTNNSSFESSGSMFIEGEEISYTSKGSSTQFNTIVRGINNITVTGTVDRDQSDTPEVVTGPAKGNSSDGNKTNYFVPTQKQLESFATTVVYDDGSTPIQLVVQTSGGTVYATYDVAISQARFDLAPGTEDRFSFSLTFVAKDRQDS